MNQLTTSKVIAYLTLIFIAGGATGAVVTLKTAHVREAQPPSMEKVCTRIQDRLRTKLSLTDEQLKKLQPIFEETGVELRAIRAQAIHETDKVICSAHQQISKELSPEQKVKLEQFDSERREWMRRRLEEPAALKAPADQAEP